jgi:hypothetical protein
MTTEFITRCWLCGFVNEAATEIVPIADVGKPDLGPSDGHLSFCWQCGVWGIFDSRRRDGTREPTASEAADIRRKPECRLLQDGWHAARGRKQ